MASLFSTPSPPKPQPMPDPQDPRALDIQKQQLIAAQARSGRASTILSGNDSYSGRATGAM
ncbi:MAG: hypothetical protein KGP14_03285 [Betaproteobacteria bacterium]|nr:hypothetical protein [Betaproteobacteria bacterium]